MRRLIWWMLAAVVVVGCARMGPPPGGPVRITPPVLLATLPTDSNCTQPGFRGDAEFVFDEVVSEGSQPNFGQGTGDLEKLVMLSPDTLVPVVRWHRSRITVHPKHGWKPNTVYRIELAPGLGDLRNHFTKKPALITFVTGPTCPAKYLTGRAVDWSAHAGATTALIIAMHFPDSARYRSYADSNGRFRFGPLPDGSYLVYAVLDQNRDHKLESGEGWDTVRAAASQDSVGEIWAFVRDTLPPKIASVARQDSASIAVTFVHSIDPYQHLDSTSLRVGTIVSGDTVSVAPLVAYPKAVYDSVFRPPPKPKTPAQDSAAVRDSISRDSAARFAPRRARGAPPLPVIDSVQQKRPTLGSVLVIHTRGRIEPGRRYFVEVRDVRSAGGVSGPPVSRAFDAPKAVVVDTTKTHPVSKADSLKGSKADSLKASRPDSLKAPRPDTLKPVPRDTSGAPPLIKKAIPKPKPDSGGRGR
ncbi:MAG: Ig-like domain-containing protein [Gemmatimonadales bacterium]